MFYDRIEAGKKLAEKLKTYKNQKPIVLALPRGGVPVGLEVAKLLGFLDVVIVRKLGAPGQPEFGIGAIAEGEVQVLNQEIINVLGISPEDLNEIISEESKELKRRIKMYRGGRQLPSLKDKTVILVDDGLATGVTAKAAIIAIKKQNPRKIIFASPVCALDAVEELSSLVDEVVCVAISPKFQSVGSWYQLFPQVSDNEVLKILKARKVSRE